MDGTQEIWRSHAIQPVAPEDDRPSVPKLLLEYDQKLSKVRTALQEDAHYNEELHDDLWILRFCLSHARSRDAIKAAITAMKFREKHGLDKMNLRHATPPHETHYCKVRYDGNLYIRVPDPRRGPILLLDISTANPNDINELSEEEWYNGFLYNLEYTFQWCDFITRTTGRLTKGIRCADLSSPPTDILHKLNPTGRKRDARIVSDTQNVYPQMTEYLIGCNPSYWMYGVYKIMTMIFPKKVVKKVRIVKPQTNKEDLDILLRFVTREHLPKAYGGENTTHPRDWPIPSQ